MPQLTVRQERFCQEFVELGNGAEAYRRAGYKGANNDAHCHAGRMITKDNVLQRIAEIRREREAKTAFSRDDAIRIMGDIVLKGQRDSDRIAAANVIGRWNGWDAPQCIVVSENPLLDYLIALRSEPLLKPAAGDKLALEGKEASRW
jgi:terminase small subunit-like protein